MVHLVPQPKWRRRIDRLAVIAIFVLGVVVAVVAVVALRQPTGHQAALAGTSSSVSAARTPSTSASGSRSPDTGADAVGTDTPSTASATATATATATGSRSAPPPSAALKATPLVVLNNTSRAGLGRTAAKRFAAAGWTVTTTGNLVNSIISTCAYYDPSVANSQLAATALRQEFPAIERVAPKFVGLPTGPVVVVLTADYH